jgi:aquaporin Z
MITNKLIAEFIGTLFLVTAALLGGGVAAAATLCICIYAMGHISGGHYNPAVSLGVWLRGRMTQRELIEYLCAQFAAAIVAFVIVRILTEARPDDYKAPEIKEFGKAIVAEFLFTFLLVSTVLHVATTKALANNQFYGAAIGLCVLAGAACVGPLTGGAFNPAVGLGIVLGGFKAFSAIAIYLLACFGGGAVAAVVFRVMLPNEHAPAVTAASSPPPSPPPAAQ